MPGVRYSKSELEEMEFDEFREIYERIAEMREKTAELLSSSRRK